MKRAHFLIFKSLWQRFKQAIIGSSELQVWQAYDRNGNIYWQAYDPACDRSIYFGSEAEMRMWIEQYYYRFLKEPR